MVSPDFRKGHIVHCHWKGFLDDCHSKQERIEMMKLNIFRFALLGLGSRLPNQVVSEKVSVTRPEITLNPLGPPVCEKVWTDGGVTHMLDCVMKTYYTSDDDFRLVGTNTMTMNRNVFSPEGGFSEPTRGHGNWVLDAEEVPGGYWAGTFIANIDATGYMTVNIRGKGYGTLNGLLFETTAHGMDGSYPVTITELPSYDGPEP